MAKGYNKRNKLLRIQDIQNAFKEEFKQGMVIEWVFQNRIKDRFRVGRNTFYQYLKIDVKKELENLDNGNKNKTQIKQTSMDFFSQQS